MTRFLIVILAFPLVAFADITRRVVAVTDRETIKVLDDDGTEHKVRLTEKWRP